MSFLNMKEKNLDESNMLLKNVIIMCSMNNMDIHIRMTVQNYSQCQFHIINATLNIRNIPVFQELWPS